MFMASDIILIIFTSSLLLFLTCRLILFSRNRNNKYGLKCKLFYQPNPFFLQKNPQNKWSINSGFTQLVYKAEEVLDNNVHGLVLNQTTRNQVTPWCILLKARVTSNKDLMPGTCKGKSDFNSMKTKQLS